MSQAAPASDERKKKATGNRIGKRLNIMRLRLQSRLAQFETLSPLERERTQHAFSVGILEQGAAEKGSKLTERGALAALTSLGARGAGAAERDSVRITVEAALEREGNHGGIHFGEFVLSVVPSAREAVAELRSRQLVRRFEEHDRRGVDLLTQQQCLEALRVVAEEFAGGPEALAEEQLFWESFVRDYPSILQRTQGRFNTTDVDLAGFKSVASQLELSRGEFGFLTEKRVCKIASLDSATEARHFGEIARLHRAFTEHADSEEDEPLLPLSRSLAALMALGVVPSVGRLVESARVALRERAAERQLGDWQEASTTRRRRSSTAGRVSKTTTEDEGLVDFGGFLEVVSELRKAEAAGWKATKELLQATKDTGLARDRLVPTEAWAAVIVKGGYCNECCAAIAEVEAAVQECNREGYSALSFKDLSRLLSRVVAHARCSARRREEAAAHRMGLDHLQVLELRGWWGRLTTDGVGTVIHVHKALEELDPGQNYSDDEIEQMILELQPPPDTEPLPVKKQQRRVSLAIASGAGPPRRCILDGSPRRRTSGSPRLMGLQKTSGSICSSRPSACLDENALLAIAAIGEAVAEADEEDGDSDSDGGSSLRTEPEADTSLSLGGLKASRKVSVVSSRPSLTQSPFNMSRQVSPVPSGRRPSNAGVKHPAAMRFEGFILLAGGYSHAD